MTTVIKTTYNIKNIKGIKDNNNPLSYVNINNSIQIPSSSYSTYNTSDNLNAGILIKDINSINFGNYYNLNVNSLYTTTPSLYFNNNLIIDNNNLLSEIEYLLVNGNQALDTSNIIVHGGYINFYNGSPTNTTLGSNGVGIRYSSNNTVQFKNYGTDWIDLIDIIHYDQFSELVDVDVHTNPLSNNQYIIYNSTSNLFVNSNLEIINDASPVLGGDLNINNHLLKFGTSPARFVNNISHNNLLVLKDNTSFPGASKYLEINNNDIGINESPEIIAKSSTESNVGLIITTTGSGDITLNAEQGNIFAETDSLQIRGFVKNSIYRTSTKNEEYIPNTPWVIPLISDTILFDFTNSSNAGTYLANVGAGIDGQKLNIIYNNNGSKIINVFANFISLGGNGIITGSGYKSGLEFTTSGQSSSLIYLAEGINAWQILNTGSSVF